MMDGYSIAEFIECAEIRPNRVKGRKNLQSSEAIVEPC